MKHKKVASMLSPLYQAIKYALKKATLIHADETSHFFTSN
ncbi:transposase [Shewanella sp. 3_MG-2023]